MIELIGAELDAAVHLALGSPLLDRTANHHLLPEMPRYSTDWSQGGPIIERERIELWPSLDRAPEWTAYANPNRAYGPTPLIAAMRAFVASKT